jgi:DNA mismatch repair protein MutS2
MDKRTLRILEFDKIIEKLSSLCASVLGRELVEELEPQTEYGKVQRMLKETSDAESFIIRRGSPPMGGIHDIRPVLKRVEMGSVLGPGELLAVADTLRTARSMKNYSSSAVTEEGENIAGELIIHLRRQSVLRIKSTLQS